MKSISSEYLKLPGEPIIMSGSKSLIIFLWVLGLPDTFSIKLKITSANLIVTFDLKIGIFVNINLINIGKYLAHLSW